MTDATLTERVEAGASWLDEQAPGWEERIDETMLNLDSPCNCVLGQVFREAAAPFNGYEWAAKKLLGEAHWAKTTSAWLIAHGFLQDGHSIDEMDDAWLDLLANRKKGLAPLEW